MIDRRGLAVLGCFGLGVAVALVPWFFNSRFYFHDDMQHQHMPVFLHIGRLLRAGEIPFLSLASFTSGNLLGEYQFAVLNPVSLAAYAVLPSIADLSAGALFMACLYYGVLASGTYVLARAYGVGRGWATIGACTIASNNLIAYWFASSWFPVFVSLAWFVWAWAFLARAPRTRLDWLFAVLFCYLTITSGWPQTTMMLGLLCLLLAWQAWRLDGVRPAIATLAALAAATLLASPVLLAVISVTEVAARFSGAMNNNLFVANLRDLLTVSSPFHRGFMSWGGYRLTGIPIFHVAWFIIPLLALVRWSRVEWRDPRLVAVAVFGAVALIAAHGPEESFMVRWPFRWVPYFHLSGLLLFLVAVSRGGLAHLSLARASLAFLALFICVLGSFQADPGGWRIHLAGLAATAGALSVFLALQRSLPVLRWGWVMACTAALFVATHAQFLRNPDVPDWGLPVAVPADLAPNSAPDAYTLYLGWLGDAADVGRHAEFQTGMMPRVREVATVNGYTPVGHREGSGFLCMNIFGETCPEGIPRLFERDATTGLQNIDLLRVNRIIALRGPHLDAAEPLLEENGWQREFEGQRTERYLRELPNAQLPGTVAWASPGLVLEPGGAVHATEEEVRMTSSGTQPGSIIFARLWWPGYQAELNGRGLPVRAHKGIFTTVDVPAGAEPGTVTLRFRPPFFTVGMFGIAAGFAVVLGGLFFLPSRRGSRSALQGSAVDDGRGGLGPTAPRSSDAGAPPRPGVRA